MSFREKTAWISLLSIAGIYGFYFWAVIRAGHPGAQSFHFGGLLLGTIIAIVAVQVVLTAAAAVFSPKDARAPRDERDRVIELRATRVAYSGLATAVAFACFFGALSPPIVFNTNALLFILVASELLRSSCLILQYRRQA
jgi:hypothetical protein